MACLLLCCVRYYLFLLVKTANRLLDPILNLCLELCGLKLKSVAVRLRAIVTLTVLPPLNVLSAPTEERQLPGFFGVGDRSGDYGRVSPPVIAVLLFYTIDAAIGLLVTITALADRRCNPL